ncbi:hypothetical protein GCM10014715_38120 [Streptomyces spiralis]|uniref:Secreted protein n=1 Tax=Streptomyces spiralis TaxID=66376 RepID=A0A919A0R9_9ACTN|nr:hypothetical protein [Streptomyces spiralis]GHE79322.1 hypothetical protein GCM10014715_38120 [Streptomyces spiralis]
MTSVRMLATTTGAALVLALSGAARPATAVPAATQQDCDRATAAAEQAARDYDQLKKELQDLVAAGGHPDASQRQALADADVARSTAAAQAERICDSV